MAGANKNQTKAAKAVAGAAGGAVTVGEGLRLLTPLNSGKHAYVNSGGRSVHVATSGDAFLASFVTGLIRGDSPAENLKNSIAMGAFVATKKGGCPDYDQAEFRRFKEQQLHNQLS